MQSVKGPDTQKWSGDKSPGDKSPRRSICNTFNTLFLGKNKLKQLKLHKNKATVRRIE